MQTRKLLSFVIEFFVLAILLAAVIYVGALWASTEPEATKHIRL